MGKKRITTYTFDASEKTITFSEAMDIEGFLLITNVVDNIIVYNFADPALGGTFLIDTLTLDYNTTSMSDSDELMIMYDDGVETQAISGTVTAELSTTDNTVLDNIETAVEAIQAGQLPDGHNVTVDNVSLDVNTGLTQPLTDTELRATPVPVSGTFYQATQPVSGTVTANLSATDNAVLDDIASDTEAIKGSLATAGGLVVNLGANNDVTVTSGAITETNSGAIKTAVEKIDDAISGSEMQVDIVSSAAIPITDNAGSLTVDGTVTANLSATDNAVLDDIASDTEAIKTSLAGTLTVTGGGGGVEYTEGDTDATITGSAVMMEGADNTLLPIQGTVADGLLVNLGSNNDISGTVTANLSATDNAVLDSIAAKDFATQTTLAAMNAKMVTGTDIGDVTINNASGAAAVNIQDGGNSITVDGSLTVDLGANNDVIVTSGSVTANAGTNLNTSALALETGGNLASIKTNTDKIPALGQALAAGSVPVVLTAAQLSTLTPPAAITGFATSAKQDTIIGHVDGIETVLGTIDTDTSNIVTSVQLLDNAISGSEMQVDVVGSLPAGTNAIGKLAANSGVDIGDVDVLSLPDSGQSIFRSIDLDESEEAVKASAGTLYGWYLYNNSAATLYMKLYNATVASVTVGTTTPVMTIPVPAGSAANVSFNGGITFGTAITAAVTTGVADNNTGAPAANDFIANIFYK